MIVGVALDVMLKGADLIADTAFLTLRGKMGYEGRLLGIQRTETCEFSFESDDPAESVSKLRRFLNTQSLFYNRNKHYYSLQCAWEGEKFGEGVPAGHAHRQLAEQVRRSLAEAAGKDFDSIGDKDRVIFKNVPVFRTEVLVENLDPSLKQSIARKLETELSVSSVVLGALGTCWHLAFRAASAEEAGVLTEEIAVTRKRDRGLLLNPNYQGFRFLGAEKMELGS